METGIRAGMTAKNPKKRKKKIITDLKDITVLMSIKKLIKKRIYKFYNDV